MSFTPPIGGATTTSKGIVKLAGDLAGSADSPTVPSLSTKLNTSQRGAASGVASLDTNGVAVLAEAIPGTVFEVVYNGTDWLYAGTVVTSRPTNRTDLVMQCVNAIDTTVPSWAIAGDRLLRL